MQIINHQNTERKKREQNCRELKPEEEYKKKARTRVISTWRFVNGQPSMAVCD